MFNNPYQDGEQQVSARVQYLRRCANLLQRDFAKLLDISKSKVANYESFRTPIPLAIGWEICKKMDVNPAWLLTGNPQSQGPFPKDALGLKRIEEIIRSTPDAPFFQSFSSLVWMLTDDYKNQGKVLTHINESVNNASVKCEIRELMNRCKLVAKPRGKKAELAKFLGVSMPCVSEWLSGRREPGGETTLRILNWVQAQEALQ